MDGDVEGRVLALEVLGGIVLGESDGDLLFVARLEADELLLESGDQAIRADLDRLLLGRAALESNAVQLADEIAHDLIAVLRLALVLGGKALLLSGDPLHRLVDLRFGDRHDHLFELHALDLGGFDLGQHFEADRNLCVLAFFIAFAQLDMRLHRGP